MPDPVTYVEPAQSFEMVYPAHVYCLEVTPYSDSQLIEMVNEWIDYYSKNGDSHYSETPDWRILEIYWEKIIDQVSDDLVGTDDQIDELIERIANLF